MIDKIITIDSSVAKEFGFTSDKFLPLSYLWQKGDRIFISVIESRHKRRGYFKALLNKIWEKGYQVAIPVPLGAMRRIVKLYGFQQTFEYSNDYGEEIEVWGK